jgi:hypothetical protein
MSYGSIGITEVVAARRSSRLPVPKVRCPPGKIQGGYVWTGKYWRRARAGECGTIPDGMKSRRHGSDGSITHSVGKGGKMVKQKTTLSRLMQECIDAGVPEPYRKECFNLRSKGMPLKEAMARLQGNMKPPPDLAAACANAGIPSGMVGECAVLLQQGVPMAQIVAAAGAKTTTAAAAPKKKFPTMLVLAAGGGLLALLLLRRKK